MTKLNKAKIKWMVRQVVKHNKKTSEVASVYGITSRRVRQLQLLSDSFKNIKETETRSEKYRNSNDETIKEWDGLLFNSIEHFAFLVNEKFIKNKKISGFFDDAVVGWYEEILLEHYKDEEEVNNPKIYPEFKKLYNSIKLKNKVNRT